MDESHVFVLSSRHSAGGSLPFFRGLAFHKSLVILGESGLGSATRVRGVEPSMIADGRFVLFYEDGDTLVGRTDPMAQNTIYFYEERGSLRGDGYWAVSNSLLALAERIAADGIPLKFHETGVLSFFVGNRSMWGGQPLSTATLLKDVEVLPAGYRIEIEKWREPGGKLRVVREDYGRELPVSRVSAYRSYVNVTRARVAALAEAGLRIHMGLSGGIDSRFNLGVVLPLLRQGVDITISSDRKKPVDLAVAENLSRWLGFPINQRRLPSKAARAEAGARYRLWKLGSAGVYLPVLAPRGVSPAPTLNIHGANFKDASYRSRSATDRARIIKRSFKNKSQGEAVASEFSRYFSLIGLDMSEPTAMDFHYRDTRGRFHNGSSWFRDLSEPLFTPHLSRDLWDLYLSQSPSEQDRDQMIFEFLQLMEPDLANVPFDRASKFFPHSVRGVVPRMDRIGDEEWQAVTVEVLGSVPTWDPEIIEEESFEDVFRAELLDAARMLESAGAPISAIVEEAHVETATLALKHMKASALVLSLASFASVVGDLPLRSQM